MQAVLSKVFNQRVAKWVFAVSIPVVIAWVFIESQKQADQQMKEYEQGQKEHPTHQNTVLENYAIREVDDANNLRWELTAKTGNIATNNKDVALEGVQVRYFDSATHAIKMTMTAPWGTANQDTKFVKLKADKGHRVLAEGQGGKSKFECEYMEINQKNQFEATGGVVIDWPGVAKVSANQASGSTNMADGPKNMKLIGNAHTEIAVR